MNNSFGSFISIIFVLAVYAYGAYAVQLLAKKTNTPNAGLAWVPIVNIYLVLKIAGKPGWWFILVLLPLVNIVIFVMVWMAIATAVHKANWLGFLMLIPVVNFFVLGYLAFSETPTMPQQPNQIVGV